MVFTCIHAIESLWRILSGRMIVYTAANCNVGVISLYKNCASMSKQGLSYKFLNIRKQTTKMNAA